MKVSYSVIGRYLRILTEGYGASHPETIEDWETYHMDINSMIREARANDDEDLLKYVMDSLIVNPKGRIDEFVGQVYAYSDDDMVDLYTYAFEYLWPNEIPSYVGYQPDVEFVPMSDAEWAARRNRKLPEDKS